MTKLHEPGVIPKFRKRQGRCYELSYITQARNKDWTLVHGNLTNGKLPTNPYPHAWIEVGELVIDLVLNRSFRRIDFYYGFIPVDCFRYSRLEAAQNGIRYSHFGPWHDLV